MLFSLLPARWRKMAALGGCTRPRRGAAKVGKRCRARVVVISSMRQTRVLAPEDASSKRATIEPNVDSAGELLRRGCQRRKGCDIRFRWARFYEPGDDPYHIDRHRNQD